MIEVPARLAVLRACWLLTAAVLAATVLPRFALAPDLVVLVVVAVALRAGPGVGALTGLVGGWLVDLVPPAGGPLGATALLYALVGAVTGTARQAVAASPLMPALAALAASTVVQLARITGLLWRGHTVDWVGALGTVACSTIVGALLIPPLVSWEERLLRRGPA